MSKNQENDIIIQEIANIVSGILKDNEIHLTSREEEILYLLLLGYSNEEIEFKLFITNHTVKKHLNKIYSKFYLDKHKNSNKRIKLHQIFVRHFFNKLQNSISV